MTNEIRKREKFEFEFGLKIEREMTRCISWINGNIQAKGGSMFVDVDENLKREKNICSRFEDKRGNTNTIIHEYTDVQSGQRDKVAFVFSAERMNGLANRENYRANPMFSWKPEFRV